MMNQCPKFLHHIEPVPFSPLLMFDPPQYALLLLITHVIYSYSLPTSYNLTHSSCDTILLITNVPSISPSLSFTLYLYHSTTTPHPQYLHWPQTEAFRPHVNGSYQAAG